MNFCTIVTQSHLPFAKVILDSLNKLNPEACLHVLVVDNSDNVHFEGESRIILYSTGQLQGFSGTGDSILRKYSKSESHDLLRWSLKPIYIQYLLSKCRFDKVIFTDPDTYYFSDFTFLFDLLNDHKVLLTPHWMGSNPEVDKIKFNFQFKHGLYNAGFIGVNYNALEIMEWWAELCLYKCEINNESGFYVDQTYLNLMPLYFADVHILKHKGCNIANWNLHECTRTTREDNALIDDQWEIVFIHFTRVTIEGIVQEQDPALKPYLNTYIENLNRNGVHLDLRDYEYKNPSIWKKLKHFLFG